MNAKVAELYRNFASVPKVQFISISIDPERDSLEALRKYAETFSVSDNRWLFLRTSSDKVHHLAEKVFMVGGESPSIHSTKLILVDAQAQIRGFYSSEEKESLSTLKTHIGELLRK